MLALCRTPCAPGGQKNGVVEVDPLDHSTIPINNVFGMGFGKSCFHVAQGEGRLDSLIEFAALLLFKT